MQFLKQSTAATIVLGPFVDDTDGKTAETALTISQADIRLTKNGGTFAQTNNTAGATHMENGYYSVPLDTTDTNTLGRLTVAVAESGALAVWREFMVLPANPYDSLVLGTDNLDAEVATVAATAANKIADHCRRRTQANVEASSDGDALSLGSEYGVIQQMQESNLTAAANTLTVYRTDGTTSLGTRAVTTDGAAAPITGVS